MPDGKPTLKERLENHIVVVVSTFTIAAFVAGWGAHAAITPSGTPAPSAAVDWQSVAREKGWIDKSLCPAMPLVLRLISPSDGATVQYGRDSLEADVIVS